MNTTTPTPPPPHFSKGELVLFYPCFATVDSADAEPVAGLDESGDLLDAPAAVATGLATWWPR